MPCFSWINKDASKPNQNDCLKTPDHPIITHSKSFTLTKQSIDSNRRSSYKNLLLNHKITLSLKPINQIHYHKKKTNWTDLNRLFYNNLTKEKINTDQFSYFYLKKKNE